ncbi:hypothetical protein [Sinorhizobium medicae]|uniref:hypothetical protein n=1 Tax=Sinorhizobium medicae TaxID=110321 RepID=UPI0016470210|nr:hypothetical protein [Sinorhizobium medicae]MDX1006714.1 hypothetical protein [Sinorhizobium medicae]
MTGKFAWLSLVFRLDSAQFRCFLNANEKRTNRSEECRAAVQWIIRMPYDWLSSLIAFMWLVMIAAIRDFFASTTFGKLPS